LARKNATLGWNDDNVIMICCSIAQQLNACVAQNKALQLNLDGKTSYLCSWCGAQASTMLRCPCDGARYCNAACQQRHWPTHRPQHQ
jgi:hypothetical protein